MGFLNPLVLLALPLAALPLILAWSGRRSGDPVRFSSLYLIERARRSARRAPTRSRWIALVRCAVVALLVLAAARPVGCGAGDPALHRPTRAIVAVDVSRSTLQSVEGAAAWTAIAAAADAVLAAAAPDDRVALAAVADGLVGWWEAPPAALRERLAALAPTARRSDWPTALAALSERETATSETYLVTDGSTGARGPGGERYDPEPFHEADPGDRSAVADPGRPGEGRPRRVVHRVGPAAEPNRALAGAVRLDGGRVALRARSWGADAAAVAEAGRRVGEALEARAVVPLDGAPSATTWSTPDTATFALAPGDPLAADDLWRVARGADGGAYRVGRWTPGDEPPDPGALFWEAALEAADGGVRVERFASLSALARAAPDLALLPIRGYAPGEAALLADLAAAGTRLLFAPACPEVACAPPAGWMPAGGPAVPDLEWRLADPDRRTTLEPRPVGSVAGGLPEPLSARAPIRGALTPVGGGEPALAWELASGAPALWAGERAAVWLVPLGPPVTRLAETPLFPLVAETFLAAWDPAWRAGASGATVGEPLPLPEGGATVTGPVGAADPETWRVSAGEAGPRPDRPGLYRIEPADVREAAGAANFVAVNGDPAEGDLTAVPAADWAAWGRVADDPEAWRAALFPSRRGPDLWPWLLALALTGLVAERSLARGRAD